MIRQVAALYVVDGGCYCGLDGVDPWPESRDARLYAGPHPVVAHPPCERWGSNADGGNAAAVRRTPGDDGGCFVAALLSVRRWGGVLEHPAGSKAWAAHGLARPPRSGGWIRADDRGWTCCVSQGHYGHLAAKSTWLYAVTSRTALPVLIWGACPGMVEAHDARLGRTRTTPEEIARARKTGVLQRLSRGQRMATPIPFRDLLISIARSCP